MKRQKRPPRTDLPRYTPRRGGSVYALKIKTRRSDLSCLQEEFFIEDNKPKSKGQAGFLQPALINVCSTLLWLRPRQSLHR